ncbi:MAG: CPBP family intramembrane metalloprotease [Micrococcales bacterium]|nr:CPBP family intramembrane metalloprotease [Micrococcales bacterium]
MNTSSPKLLPVTSAAPRALVTETVLVLGVSLGASAIYAVLEIIKLLTARVALNEQTAALNQAVTPDRPWLDLAFQLANVGLGVMPALLALHLLTRDDVRARALVGADLRRPGRDFAVGAGLTALAGIPGLGLYVVARSLGLNATVSAAGLEAVWWAVPVLVLAAAKNAILEEVVMLAYLFTRWGQAGWHLATIIGVSALIRGGYHLYQGFGGFVGNVVMGLVFGLVYARTRRVMPLVVAHTLLDVAAFVGYTLLRGHVSWL